LKSGDANKYVKILTLASNFTDTDDNCMPKFLAYKKNTRKDAE